MGEEPGRLLDSMARLPEGYDEVVGEILCRAAMAEHSAPDDGELLHAADRLFLELDRRERPV